MEQGKTETVDDKQQKVMVNNNCKFLQMEQEKINRKFLFY
jgi:hypothetical protein